MGDRVKTFRNARCRFLIVKEGRWHAGWTQHLAQGEARVRLKTFVGLATGEEVVGECYGDGAVVRFSGRVAAQMGQEVSIGIVGSLGFETCHESIRIEVVGIEGTLHIEGGEQPMIVADVSPASLGGFTGVPLRVGTVHDLTLRRANETIQCRVGVANCQADPTEAGACRVGFRIVELSRLDGARWSRLIDEMAAR